MCEEFFKELVNYQPTTPQRRMHKSRGRYRFMTGRELCLHEKTHIVVTEAKLDPSFRIFCASAEHADKLITAGVKPSQIILPGEWMSKEREVWIELDGVRT